MGRGVTRVTQALAVLLATAGSAFAQTPAVSIGPDQQVVEGNSGTFFINNLTLTLSGISVSTVRVFWTTVSGSATAGSDFVANSGFVDIPSGNVSWPFPVVEVIRDTIQEPSPSQPRDEVFFVDLTSAVNGTISKGRVSVVILDDDYPLVNQRPGVQFLSAVSDGTGPGPTDGRNRLQWRVPAAVAPPNMIEIRWNTGGGCSTPGSTTEGSGITIPALLPGQTQRWEHAGRPLIEHCYSVFAMYSVVPTLEIASIKATPVNSTGPVKWSYATGFPNVVPPTVGADAIYTVSTNGVVHAMERGPTGGPWPTPWNPVGLGRAAHNRSAVVPFGGNNPRLLVGTESGEVHAVDARNGWLTWSRSQAFGTTQLMTGSAGTQAAPAALLKNYGGQNDLVLVGTTTGTNITNFFALNPANGTTIDYYPNGPVGPADSPPGPLENVGGMAVVDYAGNRVFFGTAGGGSGYTLWSLDLGPMGSPNLTRSALAWNPKPLSAGTNGSPVMRGGRLYVGTTDGKIHSFRLADGALSDLDLGDGEAKGFLFPDRRNGNLYLSTSGKVWGVRDDVEPANPNLNTLWVVNDIPNPSIVLQRPGTDMLYVGGGDGRLYKIDVASADPQATKTSVLLEPGAFIGAPSLDLTHDLVLVGSSTGVVYAVRP